MSPTGTELSLEECALWTVRDTLSLLSRAHNKNMPNATFFFFFKLFLILRKMLHRLPRNIGSKGGWEGVEERERLSRNAGKNRHEKVGPSQIQICWCSFANFNSRTRQLETLIVRDKSFKHNFDVKNYSHSLPPHYLLVQTPPGCADVIFYSLEKALGCLLGCMTSNLWGFTNTTHTFVPNINPLINSINL